LSGEKERSGVFMPRMECGGAVNDDVDLTALSHKRIHWLGQRERLLVEQFGFLSAA
jgi:hypothetical protein